MFLHDFSPLQLIGLHKSALRVPIGKGAAAGKALFAVDAATMKDSRDTYGACLAIHLVQGSTEPAGDVIFRLLLFRIDKDFFRYIHFDEFAQIEES